MKPKAIFTFLVFNLAVLYAYYPESRGQILASDGQAVILSPVGGYVVKKRDKPDEGIGEKGLQKYYDDVLSNGTDVQTTIHRQLQDRIEQILDQAKVRLNAQEVLAMVMDSKTGAMLTMASSNRYDPLHIRRKDVPNLTIKFTKYQYEPGAVMMPFTAALVLSTHLDDPNRIKKCIDTHNGTLYIGKIRIVDKAPAACRTVAEVVEYSSNVGIAKLALGFDGPAFYDAFRRYGFGRKTGIDLPKEATGILKNAEKLDNELHRAATAYGYGLTATPLQLLKAYAAFANDGYAPTPHLFSQMPSKRTKLFTQRVARQMQTVLADTAKSYPAFSRFAIKGVTFGAKASSAFIAKKGKYSKSVHSSLYGFVRDGKNRYALGIVVIDPKNPKMRYASHITPPLVAKIVRAMQEEGMLHTAAKKGVSSFTYLSPLASAKVVEPFGETFDATYGIKVPHPYVVLKPAATPATVRSIAPGSVVFAGESSMLGNVVVVKHEGDIYAVYGHLAHIAPSVHKGKKLKAGEILGNVEKALYFQIKKGEDVIDPREVIGL